MIGRSKYRRENYPRKCLWTQGKQTCVKFNPRLSANRPSNNLAQETSNWDKRNKGNYHVRWHKLFTCLFPVHHFHSSMVDLSVEKIMNQLIFAWEHQYWSILPKKINSILECFRENTLHSLQQEGSIGMRRPQVTEMVSWASWHYYFIVMEDIDFVKCHCCHWGSDHDFPSKNMSNSKVQCKMHK